ncbi:gliding motility-associated C-terminal domain-containing protein, partial [Brumimicrobium mesophilum]|uniref:gliding motility-associated C-terminal domain-containing protein n=1 Tax=Brumimicrobium mesophilum TaxID=392717 RepID=UPI00131D8957
GPFTINSPAPIVIDEANLLITNESCNGNDGSITGITAFGGSGTLTFSWTLSTATTLDLNALSSGSYTLTVTDAQGCSETSGPHLINQIAGPTFDDANVLISNETCGAGNGSISGITANGTGLTYDWSPSGAAVLNPTGLSGGTHTLLITDAAGCSVTVGPYTLTNTPSLTIDVSGITINPADCEGNNGSITGISVSGGTAPFIFEWNGTVTNSIDLLNTTAGSYGLQVTDANACVGNVGPFTIQGFEVPVVFILTPNQIIENGESVAIQSSVDPVNSSLLWTPATGLSCSTCLQPIASPNVSTWYVLSALSDDGCLATDSIYIEVLDPCGQIKLPTVFSPNGDGLNDEFCVLGNCIQSMVLQIYNRWGEVIFETTDSKECWNGKFKGEDLNTGVYIYKLKGMNSKGESILLPGNVNLLR